MNRWMDELQESCPALEAPAGHTGLDFSHSYFCKKWLWKPWLRPQKSLIRRNIIDWHEWHEHSLGMRKVSPRTHHLSKRLIQALLCYQCQNSMLKAVFGSCLESHLVWRACPGLASRRLKFKAQPHLWPVRTQQESEKDLSLALLILKTECSVVVVSCSVMSDSLQPRGL